MFRPIVRIISSDKTISSPLLNRMGAQVFRTVAARSLYRLAPTPNCSTIRRQVEELRRDGAITIPDFLPPELLQQVQSEAESYLQTHPSEVAHIQHGPTTVNKVSLAGKPEAEIPAVAQFFHDPRLHSILAAAEKRPFREDVSHLAIEQVVQGAGDVKDPESDLHSDIFFDTHKAWLYLTDVTLEHGPLAYVKGSHRLSSTQLGYVYRESCGRNQGSRRIAPEELKQLGLEETVFTVPKNTLVIANVMGYHRRLRGVDGHRRMSLHVSLRVNPFLRWFRR